jgi:hypothetical protein
LDRAPLPFGRSSLRETTEGCDRTVVASGVGSRPGRHAAERRFVAETDVRDRSVSGAGRRCVVPIETSETTTDLPSGPEKRTMSGSVTTVGRVGPQPRPERRGQRGRANPTRRRNYDGEGSRTNGVREYF